MTLRITDVAVGISPDRPGWSRLAARVSSDRDGTDESVWLDVAPAHAGGMRASGNPYLCWFAAVAAARHEDLVIAAPTDQDLLEQVREILCVWCRWYPDLGRVSLTAEPSSEDVATAPRATASMFTGGVDSFFTALRHAAGEGTPRTVAIRALLFVHGFDIPLALHDAARVVTTSLQQAAGALGAPLVVVATNLRDSCFRITDWPRLSHGAALAGVAHALSDRYDTVLLGSSAGYGDLRPWGSHPLTDPMFSSARLRFVHDGAAFTRVEKTEYVVQSPIARQHLRVCWQSTAGDNCQRCNNCIRTMLALDVLGVLDQCDTFDRTRLDLERAAHVFCRHDYDVRQFGYVRALALREGRRDVAAAVDRALAGSRQLTQRLALIAKVRDRRFVGRWAPALERLVLRGWID